MSGLTPEQLAEIRGRVDRNSHPLGDRAALLDEVERLRRGIARLHTEVEKRHRDLPRDEADSLTRDDLRLLLYPNPTEGETHE